MGEGTAFLDKVYLPSVSADQLASLEEAISEAEVTGTIRPPDRTDTTGNYINLVVT